MKFLIVGLLLIAIRPCLTAQNFPSFKTLRYEEDYRAVNSDSIGRGYARLKRVSLLRNHVFVSLGGSARYQFIAVENEDWGETPESSDRYVLARHLFHTDFHAGKRWRMFADFQSSVATGKRDVSPLDKNLLEVHQLFVDYSMVSNPVSTLTLRLGRQELLYGSQRVVSVRNGPNNRQAFDGIKMIYASPEYNLNLFYSQFVTARSGSFDDRSEEALRFWGAYGVKRSIPFSVDLYYLGIDKEFVVYDDGPGREVRHSLGTRLWGKTDHFNLDIECLYQIGRVGAKSISAWTASIESEYTFPGKVKPMIGVKTEIITGDRRYQDDKINTYNPLFPSGAYFGLAALFGPANLIDFHPSFALELSGKVEWTFDYDIFWRHSLNDGIYTNNMRLIYTGRENPHRLIGHQLSTGVTYSPCRFVAISGEFKWFVAGDYLSRAGEGKDILFGICSVAFTF